MVIYTLGNPPAILLSIVKGEGQIDDMNGKFKIPTQVDYCAIMYNVSLIRFFYGSFCFVLFVNLTIRFVCVTYSCVIKAVAKRLKKKSISKVIERMYFLTFQCIFTTGHLLRHNLVCYSKVSLHIC